MTAVDQVPERVRNALRRGAGSVLIDAAALAAVRARFAAEHADSLARYLSESQSANTVRAYRSDWIGWLAWCAAEDKRALPADPLDVAVYLAAAADTVRGTPETVGAQDNPRWAFSPVTLERKSAAIAAVHAANGLPSPTRSDLVRLTLRGIRRARRATPRSKRPIVLHTLEELLAHLPAPGWPTGVARRRDALLLLVGFAGALRRGELAALSFGDVTVGVDATTREPMLVVDLAVTKTDPTGTAGHRVALPRGSRPATCPVCAFAEWARLGAVFRRAGKEKLIAAVAEPVDESVHRCHHLPHGASGGVWPLFPAVDRHGGIGSTAMSDRSVAELVKRYAKRAGLDPALFSGHSLRAGFATQAALGGASDREIMRQGRWSNPRTVHRYIRTANPLDDNAVTKLGL